MNETGERFVKADVIYVMPDCEGYHARPDRASSIAISNEVEKSQNL